MDLIFSSADILLMGVYTGRLKNRVAMGEKLWLTRRVAPAAPVEAR